MVENDKELNLLAQLVEGIDERPDPAQPKEFLNMQLSTIKSAGGLALDKAFFPELTDSTDFRVVSINYNEEYNNTTLKVVEYGELISMAKKGLKINDVSKSPEAVEVYIPGYKVDKDFTITGEFSLSNFKWYIMLKQTRVDKFTYKPNGARVVIDYGAKS